MPPHGNSSKSKRLHHLYEIRDKQENDVFKYGISGQPIKKDGYSRRVRSQLSLLNLAAGWARYFAKILLRNISGRKKARKTEREYIQKYSEKHGKRPRGNQKN